MAPDTRPDLLEGLLQACWLLETARSSVMRRWGGEYADDGDRVAKRADVVADATRDHGFEVPTELAEAHTQWFLSLVGDRPDAVPLGAAVLYRFGGWTDNYARDYVPHPEAFVALGAGDLRFPIPPRDMAREEAILPHTDLPPGRRFAIFTDVHIGSKGRRALAKAAVADINAAEPEFVVVPGDITEDGEPEQFAAVKEILDGLDAPTHVVLGNHDTVQRSTKQEHGPELFRQTFGRDVEDVVTEIGPLQVALVDSTDVTATPFPDWDLGSADFGKEPAGVASGAISAEQIASLAERLDPSRPALLVMHHELQPFAGFPPVMFGVRRTDSDALFDALSGHRVVGVVAGHTHRSAVLTAGPGVPIIEVPALKDWPNTYTVVCVTDDAVHVCARQISDHDLMWERSHKVPPIYANYVLGPQHALTHTLPLRAEPLG